MVTSFEFATAGRILFGEGRVRELPSLARGFGTRVLIVTGKSPNRWQQHLEALTAAGLRVSTLSVGGEPTISDATEGTKAASAGDTEVIIAIGGGSVVDAGKAISALATNTGDVFDYLEVIGRAQPLTQPPLPFIAVPTTAGTGAEVTRNAVLHSPEHRVKVSLRSPQMLPRVALVDSELTYGMPPDTTASTGMDTLTQLIEPFLSCRANAMTDALCREALPKAARSLVRAFHDGSNAEARRDMAFASLCGGLALANAGLGAVHGFAAPIGGMFAAPHGTVCAALLAEVLQANLNAARAGNHTAVLARFSELAGLVTSKADPLALIDWVRSLTQELRIPRLGTFGLRPSDCTEVAAKAAQSSSMKGNPVPLMLPQLAEVLERCL